MTTCPSDSGAGPASWPRVPVDQLARGDVVVLPTDVDGARVLRWTPPIRVAQVQEVDVHGVRNLVVRWYGGGCLPLSGRMLAAGARRQPTPGATSSARRC